MAAVSRRVDDDAAEVKEGVTCQESSDVTARVPRQRHRRRHPL